MGQPLPTSDRLDSRPFQNRSRQDRIRFGKRRPPRDDIADFLEADGGRTAPKFPDLVGGDNEAHRFSRALLGVLLGVASKNVSLLFRNHQLPLVYLVLSAPKVIGIRLEEQIFFHGANGHTPHRPFVCSCAPSIVCFETIPRLYLPDDASKYSPAGSSHCPVASQSNPVRSNASSAAPRSCSLGMHALGIHASPWSAK